MGASCAESRAFVWARRQASSYSTQTHNAASSISDASVIDSPRVSLRSLSPASLTVNIRLVDSPLRPADFVIVRTGQWTADGKASGGSMMQPPEKIADLLDSSRDL